MRLVIASILFVVALVVAKGSAPSPAAQAPAQFTITFGTTVKSVGDGNIVINVTRSNSPLGADRLWELLQPSVNYYANNSFFRFVPNFVVQFGINGIPTISAKWKNANIQDDPVVLSNTAGVLTFATAGPNTRTTQLFINFVDNSFLDKQGFSGVGTVVSGLDVAKAIFPNYGQTPSQEAIYNKGNPYLQKNFPKMDYITTATAVASSF